MACQHQGVGAYIPPVSEFLLSPVSGIKENKSKDDSNGNKLDINSTKIKTSKDDSNGNKVDINSMKIKKSKDYSNGNKVDIKSTKIKTSKLSSEEFLLSSTEEEDAKARKKYHERKAYMDKIRIEETRKAYMEKIRIQQYANQMQEKQVTENFLL